MDKKIIQSLNNYPRNMTGYGQNSIYPNWPNKARVAVQFVLNYEEEEKTVFCMAIKLQKPFYQRL